MPTDMQKITPQSSDASANADLDPQALAAIRELLHGEQKPQVNPDAAQEKVGRLREPAPGVQTAPRAGIETAEPEPAAKAKKPKRVRSGDGVFDRIKGAILGYRPSPKHVVLASLALLVFFRPWLVVGLMFIGVIIFVGVFLILGYDGFWRRAMSLARWYARRRPERAAVLHRKLDTFAMRWDAILDRFPEGSVDGLYLPDFGDLATADARHEDALNRRFDNMRENEA